LIGWVCIVGVLVGAFVEGVVAALLLILQPCLQPHIFQLSQQ